jgi:hypothetical protein
MELEDRVRVLERIVTDKGYDVATQIEALRDQRRLRNCSKTAASGRRAREPWKWIWRSRIRPVDHRHGDGRKCHQDHGPRQERHARFPGPRRQARPHDRDRGIARPSSGQLENLTGENRRLSGRVEKLEDRLIVLEKIVTDGSYGLANEIEALRDQRRDEERI